MNAIILFVMFGSPFFAGGFLTAAYAFDKPKLYWVGGILVLVTLWIIKGVCKFIKEPDNEAKK